MSWECWTERNTVDNNCRDVVAFGLIAAGCSFKNCVEGSDTCGHGELLTDCLTLTRPALPSSFLEIQRCFRASDTQFS